MSSEKRTLDLSPLKILTGALAATSAAVAASTLGVYGTVLGAAVMSVVATVATSVYEHAAQRTAGRVRTRPGGAAADADPERQDEASPSRRPRLHRPRWQAVVVGSSLVFVLGLGAVTAAELVLDRPVSDLGASSDGGGTTVARLLAADGTTAGDRSSGSADRTGGSAEADRSGTSPDRESGPRDSGQSDTGQSDTGQSGAGQSDTGGAAGDPSTPAPTPDPGQTAAPVPGATPTPGAVTTPDAGDG